VLQLEKSYEVKPIVIKYICDSCNLGEMLPTGKMKMFETHALFIHKCEKCGVEHDFFEKYPLIKYEDIKEII
jgi:DNA polymerase III alpha subunit (gram-positive type)